MLVPLNFRFSNLHWTCSQAMADYSSCTNQGQSYTNWELKGFRQLFSSALPIRRQI